MALLAGCHINVSIFGDSNTDASYPIPQMKWVQILGELKPEWTFIDHSIPSRTLVEAASPEGLADLDAKVSADTSFLIGIALGEADAIQIALGHETVAEAEAALDTILAHLAVKFPLRIVGVALVPQAYGFVGGANPISEELNTYIRSRVAANRLVDFWSISLSEDTWDGLHFCGSPPIPPCLTDHGQRARAEAAAAALVQ